MQDVGNVSQGWERGKETIFGQLQVMFHVWECLPWGGAALLRATKESWYALDTYPKVIGQQHRLPSFS